MPARPAPRKLSDAEFRIFTDLVRQRCGLHFDDSTRFIIEKRIARLIEEADYGSVASYLFQLRSGPDAEEEMARVIDLLTTNETYFFRERRQLDALIHEIVPDLLAQPSRGGRPVSIWSAGCSSGEEPFSIVMLADEVGLRPGRDFRLFASDISRTVLAKARRGVYREASFRDLQVGISDVFPKLIAFRVLELATTLEPPVEVVCREDKTERLLAELSVHGFDLILTDTPFSGQVSVKAFNHLLGQSDVAFFGERKLAERYRRDYPACLDRAPFLLPTQHSVLRRALDRWFDAHSIRPWIVAEFDDSALMKVFGAHGKGIFPGVSVIEDDIRRDFSARKIGDVDGVTEQFFAITVERRIKHPAVQAISNAAREVLFKNRKKRARVKSSA